MIFKEYNFKELKPIRTKMFKFLTDFQNSGLKCAKIEDWNYVSAESCQSSILAACKHYKILNIKAVIRKGEIFLVNTLISEG